MLEAKESGGGRFRKRAEARLQASQDGLEPAEGLIRELEAMCAELEEECRRLSARQRDLQGECERYRALYQNAPIAHITVRPSGEIIDANSMAARLFGGERESVVGSPLQRFVPAGSRAHLELYLRRVLKGRQDRCELVLEGVDGGSVNVELNGVVAHDERGETAEVQLVCIDATARMKAESNRQSLMAELDHRMKNMYAVVLSLARQGLRNMSSREDFVFRFQNQLRALSGAHEMVRHHEWQDVPLDEVVGRATSTYSGGNSALIHLSGPAVCVDKTQVQPLFLILHELGTNAVRFGALSGEGGRVEVSWSLQSAGSSRALELHWQERGGPSRPTHIPSSFGHRLIELLARGDLKGTVAEAACDADGSFNYRLCFPLVKSAAAEAAAS